MPTLLAKKFNSFLLFSSLTPGKAQSQGIKGTMQLRKDLEERIN